MPELPEVETVRRRLEPALVGGRVDALHLGLVRLLEGALPGDLDLLRGGVCRGLDRRGKYLVLRFDGPSGKRVLVVHLGMSGQLTWNAPAAVPLDRFRRLPSGLMAPLGPHTPDRHTHFRMGFEGGGQLLFRDPRTFGRLLTAPEQELWQLPRMARLGPDALGVSRAEFLERWSEHQGARAVKAVLLDQGFLAGVGNIYADEACHEAGIRPQAKSSSLTKPRRVRLADAVQEALERGVRNCGTTFRDFVHPDGSGGSNQEDLRVYARGGKPCLSCGSTLRKGVVATRGTVWCPRCQI